MPFFSTIVHHVLRAHHVQNRVLAHIHRHHGGHTGQDLDDIQWNCFVLRQVQ